MESLATPRRKRLLLVVLLVLAAGQIAYSTWRAVVSGHADLTCFHETSLHWWRTGAFSQAFGVRHYLPAFVVLVTPLVAWPLVVTAPLWATLNVVWLGLAVRSSSRWSAARYGADLPFSLFWAWPILLVLPFASSSLTQGQVNILVLWLCMSAYTQHRRGRQRLAAVLVAVAGVIKIYPLGLAGYWLLRGRWRASAATGLAFVVLAGGLSVAGFGWAGSIEAHQRWLDQLGNPRKPAAEGAEPEAATLERSHLAFTRQYNEFLRHNNQSLAAVIRRLTTELHPGPDDPKRRDVNLVRLSVSQAQWLYLLTAGGIAAMLAGAARHRRGAEDDFAEWSAWLAGAIAFVPIYWTHYFVLSLPAVTLLGVSVWHSRKHVPRDRAGTVLQACWLIGLPLLASNALRLIGVHCWLLLAVTLWAVSRGHGAARFAHCRCGSGRLAGPLSGNGPPGAASSPPRRKTHPGGAQPAR